MTSPKLKQICIGVGDPIVHSLSPAMHNAGYKALGLEDEFVYLNAQVPKGEIAGVIKGALSMRFRGVTCTLPHKQDVIPFLDELDQAAERIGAVNTVVFQNGRSRGFNTDWQGLVGALEELTPLREKKVALLGAGGTARAALYGLKERGAEPLIFNRNLANAETLAKAFQAQALPLSEIAQISDCEIIINTTPVGMYPNIEASLVPVKLLHPNQIVLDAVYYPAETRLLSDAKKAGARPVPGVRMLLHQAFPQFEHYTGKSAPKSAMEGALYENQR